MHIMNDHALLFNLSAQKRLALASELIASVRLEALAGDFTAAEIEAMEQEMAAIRNGDIAPVSWTKLRSGLFSA